MQGFETGKGSALWRGEGHAGGRQNVGWG